MDFRQLARMSLCAGLDETDLETCDRSRAASLQNPDLSSGQLIESESYSRSYLNRPTLEFVSKGLEDLKENTKLDLILQNLASESSASESLLMNEDIDCLLTVSSQSSSLEFTLSESQTTSTIFPTFISPNCLLKSLPVSPNGTGKITGISFETADPRYLIDRIDLEVDELEENSSFSCESDAEHISISVNAVPDYNPKAFSPYSTDLQLVKDDNKLTQFQAKDTKCTCDRCAIF